MNSLIIIYDISCAKWINLDCDFCRYLIKNTVQKISPLFLHCIFQQHLLYFNNNFKNKGKKVISTLKFNYIFKFKYIFLNFLYRSFKGRKRPRLDKLEPKTEKQDPDEKKDDVKMEIKGSVSSILPANC